MRLPGFVHQKETVRLAALSRSTDIPPYSAADIVPQRNRKNLTRRDPAQRYQRRRPEFRLRARLLPAGE
jgi:hypothetical protein